ncbi:MAG: branched-chain amino acid ABC transporter permease [Caldilineales bacterium]|nr:branched-chain amino acid ABC transporter permease [Caldilineales bacterium]
MRVLRNPGFWIDVGLVLLFIIWGASGGASRRETWFTVLLFVGLASSLNILLGYTGYVSFGHIVFFGFGGYIGFFLISEMGWNLGLAALVGGLVSGVLALLLGLAILRLRGAYFALATIGINEAMKALVVNIPLLGGPNGMRLNFSVYRDYGGAANALWIIYVSVAAITLITVITSFVVKKSKFGLGLMAIREDEDAAEVMGVIAPRSKTWAYVLSAIFPGILGVLFFFKQGIIEPGSAFRLHMSIELLVMVMLGGQGTVLGPILGAAVYQGLRGTLLTSDLTLAGLKIKDIQLAVAGVLLLLIVLFIPSGAVGWLRSRSSFLRRVLE